MRVRVTFFALILSIASAAFGKEVFLAVGGSANSFFTDARIWNPNNKEITIQAYYLPRGNNDNSGEQPVAITLAPRTMRVFDNVVQALFQRGDVGAIRLTSPDEFVASQRIYSLSVTACGGFAANCTLGQFVPGHDLTTAMKRGVLIGLKTVDGKFRTNVGAVNPNNVEAKVTWRLYDKDNNLVSAGVPVVMPPFGVIGPTQANSSFFVENPGPAGNLTDFWMTFSSDQPIFAYASVLDNPTNDGTLVSAVTDIGTDPALPRVIDIVASDFQFSTGNPHIHAGDTITIRLTAGENPHGFALFSPSGQPLLTVDPVTEQTVERTIKLPNEIGNYPFFCTRTTCGIGHSSMNGVLVVTEAHAVEVDEDDR
jgi:hypothetical protein